MNKHKFKFDLYILAVICVGLLIAFLLTIFAPYPYLYGIDTFQDLGQIKSIVNSGYSFTLSTFSGMYFIFALVVKIIGTIENLFVVFWAFRFLAFPLYALGVYLFLKFELKNRNIALLGASLAPLLSIEYFNFSNTSIKVLACLLLPYLLYYVATWKKVKIIPSIIIILALLFIHWPMGLVNLTILVLFLIFRRIYYIDKRTTLQTILLVFLILVCLIELQAMEIVDLNETAWSIFLAGDFQNFNFFTQLEQLIIAFPIIILALAVLGMLFRRHEKEVAWVPGLCILLMAYFLPFNENQRMLTALIPIIILFMCFAVLGIYKLLKNRKIKYSYLIIIVVLLIVSFVQPYYQQIKASVSISENENNLTLVSPAEYRAAKWINDNINGNYYLITDPVNLTFFVGMTKAQGLLTAEDTLDKVLLKKKAKNISKGVKTDLPVYIYIDGRTSFWVRKRNNLEIFSFPYQAKPFKEFKTFNNFLNEEYFDLVYESNDTYIFKMKIE